MKISYSENKGQTLAFFLSFEKKQGRKNMKGKKEYWDVENEIYGRKKKKDWKKGTYMQAENVKIRSQFLTPIKQFFFFFLEKLKQYRRFTKEIRTFFFVTFSLFHVFHFQPW